MYYLPLVTKAVPSDFCKLPYIKLFFKKTHIDSVEDLPFLTKRMLLYTISQSNSYY